MKIIIWSDLSEGQRLNELARPRLIRPINKVREIIKRVRLERDGALKSLGKEYDSKKLKNLSVSESEFNNAEIILSRPKNAKTKRAIQTAYRNLWKFHLAQQPNPLLVETTKGVVCEKVSRPIKSIGLYVPGGSAPLFSTVLMLGVPSAIAKNPVRVLCTPLRKGQSTISPYILFAAQLCGITKIYKTGGAQAIAAMALGTDSIPKCDKIFGPGNAFVTEAKRQVSRKAGGPAIDMPAGPSEVMVIADNFANPAFVAADLLSQAEHGGDSQVVAVVFSRDFADRIKTEVQTQLAALPREAIAAEALKKSRIVLASSAGEAVEIANHYAPEHLILQVKNPRTYLPKISTSGSVFLGAWTPESLGDYASGTNHVLPTSGWARAYSGLGLSDFQRAMTVQEATPDGLRKLGPVVEHLARAENLVAHQRAVSVRLKQLSR